MNEQNTSIYICTHVGFENNDFTNKAYKVITNHPEIENKSNLELITTCDTYSDRLWCELSNHRHVWENIEEKSDFIGFCHYRRFFEFMNDLPEAELVLPNPLLQPFNNVAMYNIYHNADDMIMAANIVNTKFPQYRNAVIAMMDSHSIIPYNSFIMTKELFDEYCTFLFGVLDGLMTIHGIENDPRLGEKYIEDHKEKYLKNYYPNDQINYQLRSMFGGLGERFSTAFFMYCMKEKNMNPLFTKMNVVEHTYNTI